MGSRSRPNRMKPNGGSTESGLGSSTDSYHDSSCSFSTQSGIEMTEHDCSEGYLKPSSGIQDPNELNSGSPSTLDPEKNWYHLPRSSPVISRKARFQATEAVEQHSLEGSPPVGFSSTPPSQNDLSPIVKGFVNSQELQEQQDLAPPISGPSNLCPEDVPAAEAGFTGQVDIPMNNKEPQNVSCGSSESQSTPETRGVSLSDGMIRQLTGNRQLRNKNRTCSDTRLSSGPLNENQISEDLYRNSMDLDQENAHFVVVDMVLEVLEAVKWAMYQQELKREEGSEDRVKHVNSKTYSVSSCDSGYDDYCGRRLSSNRSSRISLRRSLRGSRCSAEGLAQRLLTEARKQWFLSGTTVSCDEQCLSLEEFPLDTVSMGTIGGVKLSEEIRLRSRMRGTLTWAPPRFQIIFNVPLTQRRSEVIASQHFLCAGCGTEVEPRYIKRLRYCDYLGKYFCDGCHGGGESMIPGRVLSRWDFGRYPVCIFSKQLLDSIWEQPLFKLSIVAKSLYVQAKDLQRFRDFQEQLISVKNLLRACRLSDGVLTEFQQLPTHLTEELHLFSMDDLVKVKRGQHITTAKMLLRSAAAHVETCELCQANGFICEFCRGQEVLFPFQTDICTRCQDCRACFHSVCFREPCPRCARLQTRKSLQDTASQ
ncbi:protein associated with UVRAG as autophagy enhancer [Hoplias malabaricus]|uniref:protein associated with UVRAG as autophagy enhancer n=1 Tax=Hoplias malabaricus TaxID=27720 RepID=UPI003461BFDD